MEKKIFISLASLLIASALNFCIAGKGHNPEIPLKWTGPKGYWVIESNIKNPKNSIIYFYNNDDVLMYKEEVSGVKINVNRKKVVNRLENVLQVSSLAWQKEHKTMENEMLVSLVMKNNKKPAH
jgi:hypothetical protein